jgi:colanic acid/amylovoran biosynthesis protein
MGRLNPGVFVLAGHWAYSNKGCEAIVRGTTSLLREAAGECRFISHYFTEEKCTDRQGETDSAIIHRPFPFMKRYSPSWIQAQIERRLFHHPVSARELNGLRRSFKEAEAVLMLGGDTFSFDYSNPEVYFGLSSLAVECNMPVTIWGASIGPFKSNPNFERWAAEKLRRISLLCARETETLEYLSSLGLKDNVILAADPSFFLEPSTCELPAGIENALQKGCIGLNLSPLLYLFLHHTDSSPSSETGLLNWIQVAAEVVRTVQRRFTMPVLLISHVFSECGVMLRDDYLFLSEVAKQVNEPEGVFVLEPGLNAAQIKWVISRVRVFAGARTHSTLAAISTGVPTICIGYSMKAKGIAKDVYGNLDWLISGEDVVKDPSILSDRLASLCDQELAIRAHLDQVNPVFRQRARDATKRFLDICG